MADVLKRRAAAWTGPRAAAARGRRSGLQQWARPELSAPAQRWSDDSGPRGRPPWALLDRIACGQRNGVEGLKAG